MASLRKAIDDKCRDCNYDSLAPGNWRQQVHLCACYDCPLWPVRPRSTTEIPSNLLKYYEIDPSDKCLSWPV